MTLVQMKYFALVGELLSFTKAAQALHVTQPAVSSAMKDLERECGVALFIRNKNVLQLTDEGQVLLQSVAPILQQYDGLQRVVGDLHLERRYVRVGFATLFGNYAYSRLLVRFCRAYPGIQVDGVESSASRLFEMLDDNRLDLVLAAGRSRQGESYGCLPVASTAMHFCVNREHPLSWKDSVTWEEIASAPLVMLSERFNVSAALLKEMRLRGLTPQVIHYTDQVYTVERFIENNAAAGFLPAEVAARNRYITGIPYDDQGASKPLQLFWRKDRFLFFAVDAFLTVAREYAKQTGLPL